MVRRDGYMAVLVAAGTWALAAAGATAVADEPAGSGRPGEAAPAARKPAGEGLEPTSEWRKPLPIGLSADYTLVSDYIWRGANFSEYAGEGAEAPNHQVSLGASYDAGRWGVFGAAMWFEFFQGQNDLARASDCCLQEMDLVLSWSYGLSQLSECVPVTFETGWIRYVFPNAGGDARATDEWYVRLDVDDSGLWGTAGGVLNPFVAYYLDVDDVRGSWLEVGIGHDFALAEMGMDNTPVLKNVTVAPSLVLGIDHRYWSDTTRLGNLLYGLAVGYDLSGALGLPERYGILGVSGFLNYSQPLADSFRADGMNGELYGGVSVGWQW